MTHPTDIQVGKQIKLTRQYRGMSQEDLASKLGVTFQQIQKYETAQNRISASRLCDLAFVLGVPVGHFFGEALKIQPLLDKVTLNLITKFSQLPPDKQRLISKLVKEF